MSYLKYYLIAILCLLVLACSKSEKEANAEIKPETKSAGYNQDADPIKDLEAVIATASETGQRIMLEVGGEWCIWCHRLEEFIQQNEEIKQALHKNFIVVKVNYSKENKNEEFLSQYPKIAGYPHIFILEPNGNLLHSQNTGELEAGKGYDFAKVMAFLEKWKPTS